MNVCLVASLRLFKALHIPPVISWANPFAFPQQRILKCSSRLIISVEDNLRKAAPPLHWEVMGEGLNATQMYLTIAPHHSQYTQN